MLFKEDQVSSLHWIVEMKSIVEMKVPGSFWNIFVRSWLCMVLIFCLVGCEQAKSPSNGVQTAEKAEEPSLDNLSDSVTAIRRAILRRRYDEAEKRISRHLLQFPEEIEVLELAGDLQTQLGETGRAVEFFARAVELQEQPAWPLLDKLGQQWMTGGRPFESLQVLATAVRLYPDYSSVRQRLVGLQMSLGLEQQAYEHLQWLVQHQQGQLNYLIVLSDLTRPQTVVSTCNYALEQKTGDLRPHYSLARIPAYHGRWEEVVEELRPLIKAQPDFIDAQALWGRALVELSDFDELESWADQLPEGIERCADYWMAMGVHSERRQRLKEAVSAFQQVLLINANHPEALSRLSLLLGRLDQEDQAKRVAARAAEVNQLRTHVDSLISWKNNSQESAIKAAQSLERLGRLWESTAWLVAAYPMTQNPDAKIAGVFESTRARLTAQTPWQDPMKLAASTDSLLPVTSFSWSVKGVDQDAMENQKDEIGLQFTDEAALRGVRHTCKITTRSGNPSGLFVYQSGAGGVGVTDYDLDGWPDLYFTSIDGKPNQQDSSMNRVFRNQSGAFVDRSEPTQLGDKGFSQGVAVGDYNADGFPDLFVANMGQNHLYRNNGDGTYRDVTDELGLSGIHWTTSVSLADIDGDGNCDLFEVGYCAGERVLTQECVEEKINEPRSCNPLAFPSQLDRVWRSNGSGGLSDVTEAWLGDHEPGRGMGLVVGQFDKSLGLDLYVANDMTANHLWLSNQSEKGFALSEQATLRGLAFNRRSLAQASMGVAVGDADQDSDVDFFVTHFSGDHNTYYEQVDSGLWVDRSDVTGLGEPSQRLLAYGTQWIDADNDGDLELFVANGDIDDFTHEDRFYRQPFHVYRRSDRGHWKLQDSQKMGEYFEASHLARSVVGVDFDRDRRTDVVVTHLFEPVSLLRNHTQETGNSVRLIFKGTACHRDAIGAIVTYQIAGQQRSQQLFAGDGYHCSAQRMITIGSGTEKLVTDVTVTWPDGLSEPLGDLRVGVDYLCVQGLGEAFSLDASW